MSQLQVTGEAKIRAIQGPVVANSGVITALNGAASQYVRGDGTLADFPSSSGGGSSVSYYLNSSVSQGTIGGVAYRELSKDPIIGSGTDITISSNGYVANYITDVNDPDVVIVPGGNFNCEFYFSVNNNTGSPTTYAELYKYDGSTFTLLGSSSGVPESINQGTTIAPYYFAIPVPTATLATTDRLAIRIYVNVDGRTVTLHTENSHLCQVVTTLSKGMVSLNNLTDQSQYLTTGTSGTDFNIVSSGDTHTFNIPSASNNNRGLVTNLAQTIGGAKTFSSVLRTDGGFLLKDSTLGTIDGYTSIGGFIGNLSIGYAISSTPYINNLEFAPSTSNTYEFPNLSGTLALLEGSQTFTGANTFNNSVRNEYGTFIKENQSDAVPSGYKGLFATTNGLEVTNSNTSSAFLNFNNAGNYTYTFPASSGTVALTSNLSSYVPYNGATANVDLGAYSITTTGSSNAQIFYANGNVSNAGQISMKWGTGFASPTGYSTLGGFNNGFILISNIGGNQKLGIFDLSSLTTGTQRTYTLPDASGTIALLSGTQTFTGKLIVNTGGIDNQIAAIGTAPSLRLANAVTGATINGFIAMAGATNDYITGAVAGDMCIGNQNSGKIIYGFGSGTATAFMTITSTGLGIGTSSPSSLLQIAGGGTGTRGALRFSDEGLTNYWEIGRDNNVSGDFTFNSNATERMRITSVGNTQPGTDNAYSLGVSGTRWSAVWAANGTIQTSDEREKKDIIESDLGLDFVSKLRPVSFKWKVGKNEVTTQIVKDEEGNPILDEDGNEKTESVITPIEGKRTHYGLIAQEVEELLDGKDFGGFIHDKETDIKGLRYDQFVPLLIKSIQELQAKIVTLESKIN